MPGVLVAALGLVSCRSSRPPQDTPAPEQATSPRPAASTYYEIFVRSFQDTNGDGMGDLAGIRSRLPYLQALGIEGLWLTPIHPSPSYHGYDVTDYLGVSPQLGTLEDMQALIADAHHAGMEVIMDLVLNHTSSQHPWFVDAQSSPTAEHRNWYIWSDTDPGWRAPWPGGGPAWHATATGFFYGVFWEGMPDLDYRNPAVRAQMVGVARSWLQRGADGFRVDAARHLVESADGQLNDQPETHAFFGELRAAMDATAPRAWLVAEAWADRPTVRSYVGPDQFHRAFDFDLAGALVAAFNGHKPQLLADELTAAAPDWEHAATFVSNHDMGRLMDRLMGNEAAVKAVVTAWLMLPGKAFVYYGDEIGTRNSDAKGDRAYRSPMTWTPRGDFSTASPYLPASPMPQLNNVQTNMARADSLWALHRRLIHMRRSEPALRADGSMTLVPVPDGEVVVWVRGGAGQVRHLVVVNPQDVPVVVPPLRMEGRERAAWPAWNGGWKPGAPGADGAWVLGQVPASTTAVWRLE